MYMRPEGCGDLSEEPFKVIHSSNVVDVFVPDLALQLLLCKIALSIPPPTLSNNPVVDGMQLPNTHLNSTFPFTSTTTADMQ